MALKACVFFLFSYFVGQLYGLEIPQEMAAAFKETHGLCVKESGASEDNLKKCKGQHIPEEETSKCYLDCMMKHITVTLEDSKIHIQGVAHVLTDDWHEMMNAGRSTCGKEEHKNDCHHAWVTVNCFIKQHEGFLDICHLLLFT